MADRKADLEAIQSCKGAIYYSEACVLYDMATRAKIAILEVGSYLGLSTVALGRGSLAGNRVKVYAVDPHDEFTGKLGGEFGPRDWIAWFTQVYATNCFDVVRPIGLRTDQMDWHLPLDLVFVDGDHSDAAAWTDMTTFAPHVVPGGFMAFHDCNQTGPAACVMHLTENGWTKEGEIESTWIVRRNG